MEESARTGGSKFYPRLLMAAVCVATLLNLTGCSLCRLCEPDEPELPAQGEADPPSIYVPQPGKRRAADANPSALPTGAKAHFPAYDGDKFFVTLPVAQRDDLSAQEVLDSVVKPVLDAVGFSRGAEALGMPPENGVVPRTADLKGLAAAVDVEFETNKALMRPKTQRMLDVLAGRAEPDDEINMAFEMGEGMSFSQYVAGIERKTIQYPFQQVHGDVPIEHTKLLAARWEGQTITSIRGTLYNYYAVKNEVKLSPSEAVERGKARLDSLLNIRREKAIHGLRRFAVTQNRQAALLEGETAAGQVQHVSGRVEDGPHLVLLPYGTDSAGDTRMRYAYRMIIRGRYLGQDGPFQQWVDAQSGTILKLIPMIGDVAARGRTWNRDPGIGTTTSYFEVDPASGGQYTLQLSGIINRVDYQGDGYNSLDVSISDSTNGSSATFANFDQAPINDPSEALCASGSNPAFQQVNFYGVVYRYYQQSIALGIFTPFPTSPWSPKVESTSAGCNAWSNMDYGFCDGYTDAACPNFSTGTIDASNYMNFAHDNTIIGHELAHNTTDRFTNARPSDWCGSATCAIPVGWGSLHDLADFWADHFDSTNCTGGWVAKNQGGVDNSLYCLNSDEGGALPRLHEVTVPFNPATPGDHFPEHRDISSGGYADGQIGAAALWQVRLGMRSKCRPSGTPQFAVRFARALKETGFFGTSPGTSDTGIYRYLHDLETEMVDQWATSGSPGGAPAFRHNGPHTTNKVTGGFARTGVFLIPYQCLDGDATTGDPTSCPVAAGGENGGDAVIDIDDNDLADDLAVNGVDHPEVDFLELGGPAPTFHVWTGPRYRLDGAGGSSTLANPSPCNTKFRVQVSTDPTFPGGPTTVQSSWIDVDTDPTTAGSPECYGTWSPNPGQWNNLQSGGALTRLYYRARTRDAADGNERVSTEPGNGLWTVTPPYAVITADGRSDY